MGVMFELSIFIKWHIFPNKNRPALERKEQCGAAGPLLSGQQPKCRALGLTVKITGSYPLKIRSLLEPWACQDTVWAEQWCLTQCRRPQTLSGYWLNQKRKDNNFFSYGWMGDEVGTRKVYCRNMGSVDFKDHIIVLWDSFTMSSVKVTHYLWTSSLQGRRKCWRCIAGSIHPFSHLWISIPTEHKGSSAISLNGNPKSKGWLATDTKFRVGQPMEESSHQTQGDRIGKKVRTFSQMVKEKMVWALRNAGCQVAQG